MTLVLSSLPTGGALRPLDRRDAPFQTEVHQSDAGRARHILLKRSPYAEDDGEPIGRDPRTVSLADWKAAGVEPLGVMQAIRAKCLDCCGDQPGEVRKRMAVTCPIWPFRMGVDVFHGKRAPSRKTGG